MIACLSFAVNLEKVGFTAPFTPDDALTVSKGAVGNEADNKDGTGVAAVGRLAAKARDSKTWYATMPLTVVAGSNEKLAGD